MQRTPRFRLGIIALLAFGTTLVQAAAIYPIDRAGVLAGSKCDVKVDFNHVVAADAMRVTINGVDYARVLGSPGQVVIKEDGADASSLIVRDAIIAAPGRYVVEASDGRNVLTVSWEVFGTG